MVNPRKGILVPFNHCFYKWLAYLSCPACARGAYYFWIGWSDCLNQGTKRCVSMSSTNIAQTTLPNCLLTTINSQKQSNLMIFELSQPNWRPATFKNSYFGNARCQRHKFGTKRTVSLSRPTYNHIQGILTKLWWLKTP